MSQAVIKAYEKASSSDSDAVKKWEMDNWPKISLKCKKRQDLSDLYKKATD